MSHTEFTEIAESEISLQSVSPDWRKRLLFSDFSVDSSEAGVRYRTKYENISHTLDTIYN